MKLKQIIKEEIINILLETIDLSAIHKKFKSKFNNGNAEFDFVATKRFSDTSYKYLYNKMKNGKTKTITIDGVRIVYNHEPPSGKYKDFITYMFPSIANK